MKGAWLLVAVTLLVLLTDCTRQAALSVKLLTSSDGTWQNQLSLLTVSMSTGAAIPLASGDLSVSDGHATLPAFTVPVGETIDLTVRGFIANNLVATGRAKYTVSSASQQSLTMYFGPTTQFASHPQATAIRRQNFSTVSVGGQPWFIGGETYDTPGSAVGTTEYYDPNSLTFTAGPVLDVSRAAPTLLSMTVDGTAAILVLGGSLGSSDSAAAQAIVPATGKLGPLSALSGPLSGAAAASYGTNDLVLVGGTETPTAVQFYAVRTDFSIAETSSPSGTYITLPHPFVSGQLVTISDGVFALFGAAGQNEIDILDVHKGTVTPIGGFVTSRTGPTTTLADQDALFVLGGDAAAVEGFSLASKSPFALPSLPEARGAPGAVLFNNGSFLVAGGANTGGSALQTGYFYSAPPTAQAWPTPAEIDLANPRTHPTLVAVGYTVLALGGNATGPTAEILALDPDLEQEPQ